MYECIKPKEMRSLTLPYLASGESFRFLKFQFNNLQNISQKRAVSFGSGNAHGLIYENWQNN